MLLVRLPAPKSAAEVPGDDVPGPAELMVAGVERAPGSGPQPEVPVEAVGGRFGGQVHLVDGAGESDVDPRHPADPARSDQLDGPDELGGRPLLEADLHHPAVAPDGVDHGPGLADRQRHRLLAVDVLPGLRREDARRHVPAVAGDDDDGVDVRPGEKFPEVRVRRAALVGPARRRRRIGGFDGRLRVLPAPAVDVADGEDLGIGVLEEAAQVPFAHPADADAPDGDPLARRFRLASAEDGGRDDEGRPEGSAGGRRRHLQDLPPAESSPGCILHR